MVKIGIINIAKKTVNWERWHFNSAWKTDSKRPQFLEFALETKEPTTKRSQMELAATACLKTAWLHCEAQLADKLRLSLWGFLFVQEDPEAL